MSTKNLTIKIIGESQQVKLALERIESVFPLYVESDIKPNGNNEGVHVFVKVAFPRRSLSHDSLSLPL